MDSVSSDTSTVFSSPDSVVEPPSSRKFETSISVSSLAEKFEKNGEISKNDGRKISESRFASESDLERGESIPSRLRTRSISENASPQPNAETTEDSSKEKSEIASNGIAVQAASTENTNKCEVDSFKVFSDSSTSPMEVTNVNGSNTVKSLTSIVNNKESVAQNGSDLPTESEMTKVIEERVTYFVEKISKISQNSVYDTSSIKDNCVTSPGGIPQVSSTSEQTQNIPTLGKLSLKDLEQSFVTALNMVNAENEDQETADTLPVPSIQITEASDREDTSSDDTDETKPVKEIKTKTKTLVEDKAEEPNAKETEENTEKITPSTSAISGSDMNNGSEISAEERKAVFYISSSDLPAETPRESIENSEESRRVSGNEEPSQSPRIHTRIPTSSCWRSKTLYGVLFVVSFLVAIFGCIVYNLAHEGKIPDVCEQVGLVTTVLAGIVGAFSCFCYSCLDEFPGISRADYERIPGDNSPTLSPRIGNDIRAQALNVSPSSPKKQGIKRKYRTLSHTDITCVQSDEEEEFLMIRKSEQQDILERTEKLKNEILNLHSSVCVFISKLEQKDKVTQMESGKMIEC